MYCVIVLLNVAIPRHGDTVKHLSVSTKFGKGKSAAYFIKVFD